jgi:hypothetical protein
MWIDDDELIDRALVSHGLHRRHQAGRDQRKLQERKNRQDMTGKINGWKTILNTLTVHYGDRVAAHTIS